MMKRGEIYRADLDPVVGSEQGGIRPVVIVQNDKGNKHSPTVIVACVTTKEKKLGMPLHVQISPEESGLPSPSVVLCEQLRTLEKKRLGRRMGALSPSAMARIDWALALSLGNADTICGGNEHELAEQAEEEAGFV